MIIKHRISSLRKYKKGSKQAKTKIILDKSSKKKPYISITGNLQTAFMILLINEINSFVIF